VLASPCQVKRVPSCLLMQSYAVLCLGSFSCCSNACCRLVLQLLIAPDCSKHDCSSSTRVTQVCFRRVHTGGLVVWEVEWVLCVLGGGGLARGLLL